MRSTKDSWLNGPGDLTEEEVPDVPVKGQSVLVRGLSARYAAEVQGQMKLVQDGTEQMYKIDVASMELLQFANGCIEPSFSVDEARTIQEKYGPAFRKVVGKIDELSGIDKAAIEAVETSFPAGGTDQDGPEGTPAVPAGSPGPDLLVRTGA